MPGSELERIHSDIDMFADTSNAPLIVLLATDPLLAKRLRSAAHGLYMRLLPDLVFKSEFGLGFSLLYRHLSSLFNRGSCERKGAHMVTFKDNSTRLVKHICAQCWLSDRVERMHSESSNSCPLKGSSVFKGAQVSKASVKNDKTG